MFMFAFLLVNCKKDEITSTAVIPQSIRTEATLPNEITEKSRIDQNDYVSGHFKKIGESVLNLASNPVIRESIYREIDKKFDGDNNALINTLLTLSINSKFTISEKALHEEALKSSNAFFNIESKNFYPQLFIPFYEELLEKGVINRGSKLSGKNLPLLVFKIGDDEIDKVTGYLLDKSGKLIEFTSKINEEFAKQNEVWVISLNERVFSSEDIQRISKNKNFKQLSILTSKIEKLKVKVDYEDWTGGASDVYINGWYANANASPIGSSSPLGYINMYPYVNERRIRDVSDSELNTTLTINWIMNDSTIPWNPATLGNYMYFAIYESDSWPTARRDAEISTSNPSKKLYVTFRGKDPEYWAGRIIDSQVSTFSVNNTSIEFNTKF